MIGTTRNRQASSRRPREPIQSQHERERERERERKSEPHTHSPGRVTALQHTHETHSGIARYQTAKRLGIQKQSRLEIERTPAASHRATHRSCWSRKMIQPMSLSRLLLRQQPLGGSTTLPLLTQRLPLALPGLASTALRFASTRVRTRKPPTPAPEVADDLVEEETPQEVGWRSQMVATVDRSGIGKGFRMRTYKPRTPGLRHLKRPVEDHIWKYGPYRPLTFAKVGHAKGGRNNSGRVTVRHRGGGHRRRIRTVDFHRLDPGPQLVDRIEKDPGRSGHIALVTNVASGKKTYILAADGVRAGDTVQSYMDGVPPELMEEMGGKIDPGILAAKTCWKGNCLPLHMVPVGSIVHAVGSKARGPAVFCRSAGTYASIVSKDERTKTVILKLQSGEVRRVSKWAPATIGIVSNPTWQHRQLGKAGRSRWLNIRPTVRGVAMNAADHPHGGGRGKSKGNRHPVSPWGIPTKSGYKTRRPKKVNKYVVTPRPRNHGKRRAKK